MGNIVAIVGRPNVGKSTLFNRLVGMRKAIVDEQSGVTRDRHYGKSDWNGVEFSIIDTGGYANNSDDVFEEEIRKQVLLAIEESDVIMFMVDVTCGITDYDDAMAHRLRQCDKPILLVANKVDNHQRSYMTGDFYKFGLGDPFPVCSMNGSGTGELLDELVKHFPPRIEEIKNEVYADDMDDAEKGTVKDNVHPEDLLPRITIVGRPNVGKSSLTNALLDTERNIVTPIAGTTRDSVYTRYNKFGYDFFLVDTAGLRKKGKEMDNLEFYSVMRSIRAIEESDVCILMLDASQGIEAQDQNIFSLIIRNRKGCVIVVNKWDLIEKDTNTMRDYKAAVEKRIAPFNDVPIIFTSVMDKQRIFDVLRLANEVAANRKRRIPTRKLNDIMLQVIENYPPPSHKGKYIRIKFCTQLPTPTPSFVFFCNLPQYVRDDYKRYLENQLREKFNFHGVPMQIFIRQK